MRPPMPGAANACSTASAEKTSPSVSAVQRWRQNPVCCSGKSSKALANHSRRARTIASITLQAAEMKEICLCDEGDRGRL
ncbi:hypothetical protein MTO96_014546 [Rhipicephalus appendiculatus]